MNENNGPEKLSLTKMRKKKNEINNYSSKMGKPISASGKNKSFLNYYQRDDVSLDDKVDKLIKKQDIDGEEVNISEYLEIAYQYKFMIILIMIACFIAGFAYAKKQKDVYRAATKLFIQEDMIELQIINNKPMFKKNYELQTWVQIIKSSEIAKRTSKRMSGRLSPARIMGMITCETEGEEEYIFNISATSQVREETAEVCNALFYALKEYDTEVRSTGFTNSLDYLTTQIQLKQDELDELDKNNENFYQNNKITNYSDNMDMNLSKVNKFREMLTTSEVELSAIKANINEIKNKLDSEETDIVAQTTYSEPLKIRLMNLEIDLARTLTTYTDKHPKVLGIIQNIENVKQLIKQGSESKIQLKNMSANPIKQQLVKALLEKQGEAVALEQKIIALKKIVDQSDIQPEYRPRLNKMQRQRDALETVLVNLQNQLNDVKLNANVRSNRIFQLQEAVVPLSPLKNKFKMILILGAVLGLGIGFGVAVLLAKMDNRIKSIKDFTGKYDIPLIGTVPALRFNPLLSISPDVDKEIKLSIFDIFKHITLNFKYLILDKNHNTFAITSPIKGEGKSTTTLNMALSLARDHLNVLLVDTDFHLPRLSKTFKMDEKFGLSEVLSEQAKLEDCIIQDESSGLTFLPTGKKPPNIPKMLNSQNFMDLIYKAKKDYDIVLFDTPAALLITETSYLFAKMDGVILIGKIYHTTYNDVKKLIKKVLITGTEIFGAVLNNTKSNIFDREYHEYHDYYYKYRYGYGYAYYHSRDEKGKLNIFKLIVSPFVRIYNFILTDMFFIEKDKKENEKKEKKKVVKKKVNVRKMGSIEKISKPLSKVSKFIKSEMFFEEPEPKNRKEKDQDDVSEEEE